MNCLRLQPEVAEFKNKFPILTALAKTLRNKASFIFLAQAGTRTANVRLKPEAIHRRISTRERVTLTQV
jgi:hypothetical protein